VQRYGVATISRLLKITGLFCRISSFLQGSFAKELYKRDLYSPKRGIILRSLLIVATPYELFGKTYVNIHV